MNKEEKAMAVPIPKELPTIKKIVDCLKCGAKMEVEFEIDLEALIPATLADTLAEAGNPKEEKPNEAIEAPEFDLRSDLGGPKEKK